MQVVVHICKALQSFMFLPVFAQRPTDIPRTDPENPVDGLIKCQIHWKGAKRHSFCVFFHSFAHFTIYYFLPKSMQFISEYTLQNRNNLN